MPLDLKAPPDANYEQLKNWITTDVVVKFQGTLYKVTKVNPKNYQVVDEQGNRFNLRRAGTVQRAPRQADWSSTVETNVYKTEFKLGSPVRLKSAAHRSKYGNHVWVIIALSSGNTFRLAKLGGTPNNGYLRGFTPNDLVLLRGSFTEEN